MFAGSALPSSRVLSLQLADTAGGALTVTNMASPMVVGVPMASGVGPFDFSCTSWNATTKEWHQTGLALVGYTLDVATGDVVALCASLRFGDISGMVRQGCVVGCVWAGWGGTDAVVGATTASTHSPAPVHHVLHAAHTSIVTWGSAVPFSCVHHVQDADKLFAYNTISPVADAGHLDRLLDSSSLLPLLVVLVTLAVFGTSWAATAKLESLPRRERT
jgi:hypothetical protein